MRNLTESEIITSIVNTQAIGTWTAQRRVVTRALLTCCARVTSRFIEVGRNELFSSWGEDGYPESSRLNRDEHFSSLAQLPHTMHGALSHTHSSTHTQTHTHTSRNAGSRRGGMHCCALVWQGRVECTSIGWMRHTKLNRDELFSSSGEHGLAS